MKQESFECGKCGGQMVRGFMADYGGDANYFPSHWVEGEPVKKSLFGITGSNLEISSRRKFTVRAIRCNECGYLESYAI